MAYIEFGADAAIPPWSAALTDHSRRPVLQSRRADQCFSHNHGTTQRQVSRCCLYVDGSPRYAATYGRLWNGFFPPDLLSWYQWVWPQSAYVGATNAMWLPRKGMGRRVRVDRNLVPWEMERADGEGNRPDDNSEDSTFSLDIVGRLPSHHPRNSCTSHQRTHFLPFVFARVLTSPPPQD